MQLLEKRNAAYAQARSILEGASETMTPEEEASFDAAMADGDKLNETIERSQRLDALSALVPAMVAAGGSSAPVEQTAEYRSFEQYIRFGTMSSDLQIDPELRAQATTPNSAGGFLVPDVFTTEIIKARKAFGGIRQVARSITTSTGADLIYPTVNDVDNIGAWIGENVAVVEQDIVVGNLVLGAHKATSKLVRVSNELLVDEQFNLEAELGTLLGERIGRLEAPAWINGTGTGQPQGFLAGATPGVTLPTGSTTDFANAAGAFDALIDLEHSIDSAYRAGSTYVMNDLTVAKVRKVKDLDGRPIFQTSLAVGAPNTINGYPILTDPAMPVMAAGARSIAFGNWREAYVIRDVAGVAVKRLGERWAEFDQIGLLAFARVDGRVLSTNAYRVLVNSAT